MFRYLVLGLLRDGKPRHGWALRNEYRDRAGVEINSGSFYRELQRLVSDRLVRVADSAQQDARRTPYVILDAGRSAFDRWLASRLSTVEPAADDEVACRATLLAEGDPDRMRAALSEWQEQLWIAGKTLERERLDAVDLSASDPARAEILSLLLARRIRHVAADLEFVAETSALFEHRWTERPVAASNESGSVAQAGAGLALAAAAGAGVSAPASAAATMATEATSVGRPAAAKRAPAPADAPPASRPRARRTLA